MSHIAITYHIIFSTSCRRNVINMDHERELYKFIYDFSKDRGVKIWRIGGMPDHVHILCDIPPRISVADYVRLAKGESSKFLKMNPNFPYWERWAEGYCALSVDAGSRMTRINYIMNQKQHHARFSFEDEFRRILEEYGLSTDDPMIGE
ncbi:MAG: IS200/IS605 family transposase [Muribaculaceae bacterium]|nr:IS200/IS605 family transposase [Muribaculaceae bacterium]